MGKKIKKPIKIFTLDTETRGLFGNIFRAGVYTETDGVEEYYKSNGFEELSEILKKYDETENHVYIHNLDFDVAKIAPVLFNDATIDFDKSIIINGTVAVLKTDFCTLHDSLKLLPSSLDKLCKDFELEENSKMDLTDYIKDQGYAVYKPDGTYDEDESKNNYFMKVPADDPILNDYLHLDCKSLYKLILKVCDLALVTPEILIHCPTTPALAMTVFKTQFPEDYQNAIKTKYYGDWNKFIEEFIRMGYCGGRTEVFKPYIRNGFHYDINSLYPYVMKTFRFPIGMPQYLQADNATKMYRYWKITQTGAGFLHCRVFVPDMHIPPLPKHDPSGKLLFPVGNLEGVWTFPELMEAEKLGCEIKEVIQAVFFEQTANIFEAFITHFEAIKTTSTGAKREFAKLVQNSLYGKFGMMRKRNAFANIEKLDKIKEKTDKLTIHRHTKNLIDLSFVEYIMESRAEYIQPQIAAYVTSYARIVLLRGLLIHNNGEDAAYCDTDSKACEIELPEDMVHNSAYGKWKLESIIYDGIFLQPKFYAERGKQFSKKSGEWEDKETIKAKGVPKKIMKQYDFSSYQAWLEIIKTGSQEEIHIYDGVLNRRKFMSALKNNDDFDKPVIMKKSINLLMEQKRQMDYVNNVTYPHVRNDFGEGAAEYHDPFEQYRELLFDYYDDVDIIMEQVKKHGYIRRVGEGENFYNSFKKLPPKVVAKYFRMSKGLHVAEWCELTGWTVSDLFSEMEGYDNE